MKDLKNSVEAILFSVGDKVSVDELLTILDYKNKKGVKKVLAELKHEYEKSETLMILEDNDNWKMTVREKYLSIVKKIVSDTELTKAVMETLSFVAYKAPVMQSEIIDDRGQGAYEHIAELNELGFLTKEKLGRSFVLKLTQRFFDYFEVEGQEDIKKVFNKGGKQTRMETYQKVKTEKLGSLEVFDEEGQDTGLQTYAGRETGKETPKVSPQASGPKKQRPEKGDDTQPSISTQTGNEPEKEEVSDDIPEKLTDKDESKSNDEANTTQGPESENEAVAEDDNSAEKTENSRPNEPVRPQKNEQGPVQLEDEPESLNEAKESDSQAQGLSGAVDLDVDQSSQGQDENSDDNIQDLFSKGGLGNDDPKDDQDVSNPEKKDVVKSEDDLYDEVVQPHELNPELEKVIDEDEDNSRKKKKKKSTQLDESLL